MQYKPEVRTEGACQQLLDALAVADETHKQLFGMEATVTSMLDGKHNPGSLHPKGRAADLRTKDLSPAQLEQWVKRLKAVLTHDFDIVAEGYKGFTPATTGAHLHIEYDPKGK